MSTTTSMSLRSLVFPDEIRSQNDRPCVQFVAYNRNDGVATRHHIFLPAPAGLAFTDGANFEEQDLGAKAQAASLAMGQGSIGTSLGGSINAIVNKAISLTGQGATSEFARKSLVNPNTNTSFKSNALRTFSFSFKLMPVSAKESEIIKLIQQKFRRFTYASQTSDGSSANLDYPPVWTIRFLDFRSKTGENLFIPRIFSCYLTACETTFNSSNLYFNDSAPSSIDLSLTFQETRTLTRNDIEDMDNDQEGNRGIDDKGNPTVGRMQFPKKQEPAKSATTSKVKRARATGRRA